MHPLTEMANSVAIPVWLKTQGTPAVSDRVGPILASVESGRRTTELVRWVSGRAWSRAGAIAAVLSRGVPRRVLAVSTRIVLLLAGASMIGASVAVLLWNNFGPGPLDVFIGAIRTRTGLPLTLAVWATVGAITAIAWLLGRRPGFGTLVAPLVIGPVMQTVLTGLESFDAPRGLAAHLVVHVIGIAGIGLGAGALIVAGLGAGTGELLAAAASDRTGGSEARVRMATELTWLALGVLLGGPIGIGTLIVALLIGPAVANGHRIVDSLVTMSRRQLTLALG